VRGGQAFDLHDGTPFWPRRDGILSVHPPLTTNVRCEVAIVGAGITGALVALELTKRGHDVVVVDRRDAGGGSTSASTALLQYEIDELLIDLIDVLGQESAQLAYRECCRGIDLVECATHQVGDLCGFRRSPSVFMAVRRCDVDMLERECEARRNAGFAVSWLNSDQLRSRWGLVGDAAIESAAGASVDPYLLCARALAKAEEGGAQVFERTEVVGYELGPTGQAAHPARSRRECRARRGRVRVRGE
jgi:glycine/D-amino acid oxidase-like deaminating enzyme